MKRLICLIRAVLVVTALAGILSTPGGCRAPEAEGFAVYLTARDVPPSQMEALSHVDIPDKSVIAISDIVTYDAGTHEISLTAAAFERISNLEVPVSGKSFVVCVDRRPIYWGAFWTPISSLSFDGVVIVKPLGSGGSKVIKIELGYPGQSFYHGEDPRLNEDVMESLERAGKLKRG